MWQLDTTAIDLIGFIWLGKCFFMTVNRVYSVIFIIHPQRNKNCRCRTSDAGVLGGIPDITTTEYSAPYHSGIVPVTCCGTGSDRAGLACPGPFIRRPGRSD